MDIKREIQRLQKNLRQRVKYNESRGLTYDEDVRKSIFSGGVYSENRLELLEHFQDELGSYAFKKKSISELKVENLRRLIEKYRYDDNGVESALYTDLRNWFDSTVMIYSNERIAYAVDRLEDSGISLEQTVRYMMDTDNEEEYDLFTARVEYFMNNVTQYLDEVQT